MSFHQSSLVSDFLSLGPMVLTFIHPKIYHVCHRERKEPVTLPMCNQGGIRTHNSTILASDASYYNGFEPYLPCPGALPICHLIMFNKKENTFSVRQLKPIFVATKTVFSLVVRIRFERIRRVCVSLLLWVYLEGFHLPSHVVASNQFRHLTMTQI